MTFGMTLVFEHLAFSC